MISKLGLLENIGPDHRFMRRLAYVETRDGVVENEGGIWGDTNEMLTLIRETLNDRVPGHVELNLAVQHITSACKVDWKVPLYSGLAARLFLLNISRREAIPLATGQAHFWASHYHQG